jgi:hypothetical protein
LLAGSTLFDNDDVHLFSCSNCGEYQLGFLLGSQSSRFELLDVYQSVYLCFLKEKAHKKSRDLEIQKFKRAKKKKEKKDLIDDRKRESSWYPTLDYQPPSHIQTS